jgi:hypothetical protein
VVEVIPEQQDDNLKSEIIVAKISAKNLPAACANQTMMSTPISGRLVRASEPNLNGAMFSEPDLAFGLDSLAGAPLTWNHVSERGAYGWIASAEMTDSPEFGKHISITGRVWTSRFPDLADSLAEAVDSNTASLSMECMSQFVRCLTPDCGVEANNANDACPHILDRSGPRQMVNPTFYGAGLILDGVLPGWTGASLVLG